MEEKVKNTNSTPVGNEFVECSKCHKKTQSAEGVHLNGIFVCNKCVSKLKKRKRNIMTGLCVSAIVAGCLGGGVYMQYNNRERTGQGFEGVAQITDSMDISVDLARASFDMAMATAVSSPVMKQAPITNLAEFKNIVQRNVAEATDVNSNELVIPSIGVMFEFNTNYFVNDGEDIVKELANVYLKTNRQAKILVEGYTCDLGTNQVNDALSKLRAETVTKILVDMGIPLDNIESKWYGKSRNNNFKYPNKAEYRRVIISIK